jgi:hypothetical protein
MGKRTPSLVCLRFLYAPLGSISNVRCHFDAAVRHFNYWAGEKCWPLCSNVSFARTQDVRLKKLVHCLKMLVTVEIINQNFENFSNMSFFLFKLLAMVSKSLKFSTLLEYSKDGKK